MALPLDTWVVTLHVYFQMLNILRQLGLPNSAEVERKFEEEKVSDV